MFGGILIELKCLIIVHLWFFCIPIALILNYSYQINDNIYSFDYIYRMADIYM